MQKIVLYNYDAEMVPGEYTRLVNEAFDLNARLIIYDLAGIRSFKYANMHTTTFKDLFAKVVFSNAFTNE